MIHLCFLLPHEFLHLISPPYLVPIYSKPIHLLSLRVQNGVPLVRCGCYNRFCIYFIIIVFVIRVGRQWPHQSSVNQGFDKLTLKCGIFSKIAMVSGIPVSRIAIIFFADVSPMPSKNSISSSETSRRSIG